MKIVLAGTKVITGGITSPSQLNRGEIALFTSNNVLVTPASSITNKDSITAYEGIGDSQFKVGAILTKGSIGYTSAEYTPEVKASFEYADITPIQEGDCVIAFNVKDPYLKTAFPRRYEIVTKYVKGMTIADMHLSIYASLLKTIAQLTKVFGKNFGAFSCDLKEGVDGAPDTIEIDVTEISANTILSMSFENYHYNPTTTNGASPIGAGVDIAALEKAGAVYRGHNPQLREDEGRLEDRYFTANTDVNYKQFLITSMSEGIQDTLSTEDSKGYMVELLIALDASNAANLTAADTLFKTL